MNIIDLNKQYLKDSSDVLDELMVTYNKKYLNHKKVLLNTEKNGEQEATIVGIRRAKMWTSYNIEVVVYFGNDETAITVYKPWKFDEMLVRFLD